MTFCLFNFESIVLIFKESRGILPRCMIENLIERMEKEFKNGSKFELSLAEMLFYVKWIGNDIYLFFDFKIIVLIF